jgi:hypothetical protein
MTTEWTLPNTVTQYAEQGGEDGHISWLEVDNFNSLKSFDGKSVRTSRDLIHIAREPRRDITEKTYYLKITNFNFVGLPQTLNGIELKISMNRVGRITDDTVQLCLNDDLIGLNQASLDLSLIKIYGSETDKWGTNLTMQDIQNSSFGIVLRFQSHPNWPHKSTPLVDSVELRIH